MPYLHFYKELEYLKFSFDDSITIGRDLLNDIILDSPTVSRFQAIIKKGKEGKYTLEYLEDKNATWMNKNRLQKNQKYDLLNGTEFMISNYCCRFMYDSGQDYDKKNLNNGLKYLDDTTRDIFYEEKKIKDLLFENGIVIRSEKMINLYYKKIPEYEKSDDTVLISGETGTGKDLTANFIHQYTERKGFFIDVNCAAIPDDFMESELFGHEKGAFTGAVLKRKGKFELANNGTIFLNEIGELSQRLQAKLLDVLEKKKFYPLGADKLICVDIKIIAATNRDLKEEIHKGNFREDLYERLNIIYFHLPPLRERKEDIIPLTKYFIKKFSEKKPWKSPHISQDAMKILIDYDWPRNIRQLKNVIRRATIKVKGGIINIDILKECFDDNKFDDNKDKDEDESLVKMEKKHIIKVLKRTNGNNSKAAKILGISRETLYRKIREYNIDIDKIKQNKV